MSSGSGSQAIDTALSNGGMDLVDEVYSDFISSPRDESGERAQGNSNSASISNKKVSKFESAAAEAELDMLLNSFSETKLLDTSGLKSKKSSQVNAIEKVLHLCHNLLEKVLIHLNLHSLLPVLMVYLMIHYKRHPQ